jgi:DNA-binding transcriptional ArsR family regulator
MNLQDKVAVLKALADSSRLLAVNALAERPHCVEELAQRLDIAPSTMSFHLRKLEAAQLVSKSQNQYYTVYALRPERLQASLGELVRLGPKESESQKERRRVAQYREQVVRTFFHRGKLQKLPKQWKKQVIVAEEFLKDFDPGCDYSEKELSARLAERFPDYCTIRRILVDEGYLTRDGGIYRRVDKKESEVMTPRSDIKRQYKETERQAGVFVVKNSVNGRVLLGSSLNLHGPLNKHRFMLKIGAHSVPALQKDWNQYGPDAFVFEVIEVVEKKDDASFSPDEALKALEQKWLAALDPIATGYNKNTRIRE